MKNSDTYLAFGEWEDNCEELTLEEKGQMWDALFGYWRRGEKPTFSDRFMRACWRPIQQAIDRANEAYEAKCEQNRENGKKGGRPKKDEEEKTEKPNGYFGFSKKTEKTLPDPYPYPDRDPYPGRYSGSPPATASQNKKTKNKFKNFDERQYSDEDYAEIERKMMGG